MRPLRLRLSGLTRFKTPIDLDLHELPRGLVAVTGPNGAGKTTIMEALAPAALYRSLPSRGSLLLSSTARDAILDLELEHGGHLYRVLHELDPEANGGRGKGEAFLYEDGVPVTSGGRVVDFDAAIATRFPTEAAFLASVFGAQNRRGNFLEIDQAARRELFAELLGLSQLVDLHERAREHRKHLEAIGLEADKAVAELEQARAQHAAASAELLDAQAALGPLEDQASVFAEVVDEQGRELAELRAKLTDAQARREQATEHRMRLEMRIEALVAQRAEAAEAASIARHVVERADEIRVRAARHAELTELRATAAADWRTAQAATATAEQSIRSHLSELSRIDEEQRTVGELLRELQEDADGLPALEGEVAELRRKAAELEERDRAIAELRAELATATATATANEAEAKSGVALFESKIEASRGSIATVDGVPCRRPRDLDEGPQRDCSSCRFLAGAKDAEARLPGYLERLEHWRVEFGAARSALSAIAARRVDLDALISVAEPLRSEARRLADRSFALERMKGRLAARPGHLSSRDRLARHRETVAADLVERRTSFAAAQATEADVKAKGASYALELAGLGDAARRLGQLAAAEASLPLHDRAVADAVRALDGHRIELAAVTVPEIPHELQQDVAKRALKVDGFKTQLASANAERDAARRRVAMAEGRLQQLGDVEARAKALQSKREAAGLRKIGWALLERGLGPEGVQALEIDAAGPEVSRLTNDLLGACYGSRFTLELRTVRDAARGKVQREVFDVLVYDGLRGGSRPPADLSGGERVIVDEALKLGIALFNAHRTGSACETLWRDEVDGAMDADNAGRYPDMLRRALEIGGLRNVYYVSHRPESSGQADATIKITAGGVVSLS